MQLLHSKIIQSQFNISNQISCESRTIISAGNYKDSNTTNPESIVIKECIHSLFGNHCISACYQLKNEYTVTSKLSHPNITKPLEIQTQYKGGCMVVFPKAECDSFSFFINQTASVDLVKNYIKCMASALSYLHSQNIAHNDFKLENVLCFKGENNEISFQLSDFGFAYQMDSFNNQNDQNKMGLWRSRSNFYLSPKLYSQIMSKNFNEQCEKEGDIFSLGYTLFMILFQTKLSLKQEHTSESLIYQKIQEHGKGYINFKFKNKIAMSATQYDSCLDLLLKMLVREDSLRITAEEILNHPFLSL